MTGPEKGLCAARLVGRRQALEDVKAYLRHNGYVDLADAIRNMGRAKAARSIECVKREGKARNPFMSG
jgi:hypothetical protein